MSSILEAVASLPIRQFADGETILHENRKDGSIYILKKGAVEIQKRQTPIAKIASPGAVFGEISMLLDRAHTATVIAVEPCECHVAKDAEEFLRQHPELILYIARMLATRLQTMTDQLVELHERIDASPTDDFDDDMSGLFRTLVEYPHY